MDAAAATPVAPAAPRFNPLLPYFAVLRTDLRQTFHSWLFRPWVIVSVIAAVGYYFWGEYRTGSEAAAREARIEGARQELFDLARAQPGDDQKVRYYCDWMNKRGQSDAFALQLIKNCRHFGYL